MRDNERYGNISGDVYRRIWGGNNGMALLMACDSNLWHAKTSAATNALSGGAKQRNGETGESGVAYGEGITPYGDRVVLARGKTSANAK